MTTEKDPVPGVLTYLDKELESIAERLQELNGFCAYSAETFKWEHLRPEKRVEFMQKHMSIQRTLRSLRSADV